MRVRGSHVGNQLDTARIARGEHGLHALAKKRVEAGLSIASLRLLRQGNGSFRQTLEHQVVELATLDQFNGGLNAVARVTGAAADAKRTLVGRREAHHFGHRMDTPNSTGIVGTSAPHRRSLTNGLQARLLACSGPLARHILCQRLRGAAPTRRDAEIPVRYTLPQLQIVVDVGALGEPSPSVPFWFS